MKKMRLWAIAFAILDLLYAFSFVSANTHLTVDPLVFEGQVQGGLKYAIMPNDGPANTASVRLYFRVGSLHEKDHERGFAHFVEHMAFNGSEAFPEGELVKSLQQAGMAFGAHANASTDYQRTIYSLELPNVKSPTIYLALKAFRETASNLTFTEEAIERERGVVLSELDARAGKGLQVFNEQLKFWAPTSRANERYAGGVPATVSGATREQLVQFYRDFYRPENAYLVFVGDVEIEDVEKQIEIVFGDWKNDTPERDLAYMEERLSAEDEQQDHVVFDLEGINTSLRMTITQPYEDILDSLENRQRLIMRSFANTIFMQRFDRITRAEKSPITGARANRSRLFEDAMLSNYTVSTSDDQLFEAAQLMEKEMRRARTHGFTEDEVEQQKANFNLSYQYQVDAADKRPNSVLAGDLVSAFDTNTVFIHPEDQLAIYKSVERALTPELLNDVFAEMWSGKSRFFATTSSLIENGAEKLAGALNASRQVAVAPPEENTVKEFAYNDFGEPGAVVFREEDKDLEFTKVRFANNLKVNLKRTTFEDNTVRMRLRFGGGLAALPEEYAGLQNFINIGFVNGGLGKHDVADIPRLMAGRSASIRLQTNNGAFIMPAGVVPDDMLLQFKLWAAYLTDAAYRDKAYGQYVRAIESYFQSVNSTPGGVLGARIGEFLYEDQRFILQSLDTLKSFTMQDVKIVVDEAARNGAMELTIVGDFDIDEAIDALKGTLGTLPKRRLAPVYQQRVQQISFPEERRELTLHHKGGADQALLYMYWPTVGREDQKLDGEILLLKEVLQVMITEALRENESLAYTPSVVKYSSNLFDDFGFIAITSDIGPEEIEQAKAVFRSTVSKVVDGKLDKDVLERARKPLLERLRNQEKRNGVWLTTLQEVQTDPSYAEYSSGLQKAVKGMKREDIIAVAKRFMSVEPRLTMQVVHENTAAAQQPLAKAAE